MSNDNFKIDGAVFGERPAIKKNKYAKAAIEEMRPLIKEIAAEVAKLPTADESVRHENSIFDKLDIQRIQRLIIEKAKFKIILSVDIDYVTNSVARAVASYKALTPDGYVVLRTASSQCRQLEISNAPYGRNGDQLLWAESRALRYLMKSIGIIPSRPNHDYVTLLDPQPAVSAEELTSAPSKEELDKQYQSSLDALSGSSAPEPAKEKMADVTSSEAVAEKRAPVKVQPAEEKQTKAKRAVSTAVAEVAKKVTEKKAIDEPAAQLGKASNSQLSALNRLASRGKKSSVQKIDSEKTKTKKNVKVKEEVKVEKKPKVEVRPKTKSKDETEKKEQSVSDEKLSPATFPKGLGALASLARKRTNLAPIDKSPEKTSKRGRKRGSTSASKTTLKLNEVKAAPVDTDNVIVKREEKPSPDVSSPVVLTKSKTSVPTAKIKGVKADEPIKVEPTGLARDAIVEALQEVAKEYEISIETMMQDLFSVGPHKLEDATQEDLDGLYDSFVTKEQ